MVRLRPVVDALAFLCELWLLVVLATAGWDLGGPTAVRLVVAVALPLGAAVIWGAWLAPRSARRLADPARFAVQVVLFAAAGVVAAVAGHPVLAVVFPVVAVAVFGLTRVTAPR